MAGGGGAVPPPPRQLEVRRFASARAGELRSLHGAVSARLDGRFQQPRSARRRTTGHLPPKRRRTNRDAETEEGRSAPRQSRRVRRRRELAGNPAEGFSVAGDGARRLRTHLWHAKRFSMARRWGFVLPIGAQGSGRGSRAVLKWLKNGTIVHDASYFIPIQLDGPEDSLLSILRMVLCPSPADEIPDLKLLQDKVMRGVCYENAMLWRTGSPHSQIVGPVTYMWRPLSRESSKLEAKEGDLSNSQTRYDEGSCNSLQHQLWIWIHAAAVDERLDAIRFACEKQVVCYSSFELDSKAYSSFMAEEAADFDKAAEYSPAAMRPPRVPVPPLWHCVMASLNKEDGIVRGLEVDDLKRSAMVLSECVPVNSNCGDSGSSPTNVVSFQFLLPRTVQTLRQYVKEFDMKSLSSSSEMEIDADQPNLVSGGTVKMACSVNGLCLVRVLIRAFKEGSFDEGAVVCSPFPSDLSAWKT